MASLVCHLIDHKRIKTTLAKAKAARVLAERMVTLGKKAMLDENSSLAFRRQAISSLRQKKAVSELFDVVAPAFKDRAGGYTRISKLGRRSSDSSEMAILEWVDIVAPSRKKQPAVAEPEKKATPAKPKKKADAAKDEGKEAKPAPKKKAAAKKKAKPAKKDEDGES